MTSKQMTRKLKKTRKIRKQKGGNALNIKYNTTQVKGQELPRKLTANEPKVTVPEGYTLIMFDPDAPVPNGTTKQIYLHWLKTSHQTLWNYRPPTPPDGIHRYIFRLVEGEPSFVPQEAAPIDPAAILPGNVKGEVMFTSR